jgi:hypothetical protein
MKALIFGFILSVSFLPTGPLMAANEREPLGPASRRTGLVITEILYHELFSAEPQRVRDADDDDNGCDSYPGREEFIEIYNSNPFSEDLSGHRFAGNISYTFPSGATIPGGGFLVLRPIQYCGSLGLPGGVRLLSKAGAILAEVNYSNRPPWPLADRTGHSIMLSRPSYGQNNPKAWSLSDALGGSPGVSEPVIARASDFVRINELTSSTINVYPYSLELYNGGTEPVDLSGYVIAQTYSFTIPDGTIIGAGGFLWWQGFGGVAHLITPDGNHIVDSFLPDHGVTGVSGRYPDGADHIATLSGASLGSPNQVPHRNQVVINEIMYAPIGGDSGDEYIELFNNGSTSVDVSGWWIASHGDYSIPAQTILGPSNYLVLAKNPQRMISRYSHLSPANVVGGFSGELADDGGTITIMTSDGDRLEVTYGVGGQWGNWSRGGGSSLELKDPRSDGRFAHNWGDSDESSKGVWTTIEGIASIGEYISSPVNDQLHIFLLGAGECLVDDVEVRGNYGNGPNLLPTNPGFELGMTGWTVQGSHDHSVISRQNFSGAQSLHLRAATIGDNGANRVRSSMFNTPIAINDKVLLRARVKWIRGWPEIALRVRGGGFEVSGRMQIQPNGTPGMRNSRAVENAGPAIVDVSHEPVLPAANEPVRITAMASDPDGPVLLTLKFRVEPSATYLTLPMLDNGSGGDSMAGDGIYSATVPGQTQGGQVGFYIHAMDAAGAVNTVPQDVFPEAPYNRVFPTDAHNRECMVRWGETVLPGTFGTYRLWVNATNTARWTNRRPVLNDTPLDATFVYNNSRVIYNVRPAYHSSPWHRGQRMTGPAGAQRIDYSVDFPADDPFLGATEALWTYPGSLSGPSSTDPSAQAEQTANIIFRELGLQNNYQRFVHVFVNGSHRSTIGGVTGAFIMQDAQRPNADVMAQWAPNDRARDLLWLEDWLEYADDGENFNNFANDADLQRREITHYTSAGKAIDEAFQLGAYRFMWRPRELRPGESVNDLLTLFAMVNAVSPTTNAAAAVDLAAIEGVIDYKQWMRVLAVQHAAGNWDTYGYDRGRNAYAFKPETGPVQLWNWDNNFTMGIGGHGVTMDFFTTTDLRIAAFWREPTILRAYWRAFYDIISGPLQNSYLDPILDAKAAAFVNNGVSYSAGTLNVVKNYIRDRRNYISSRLSMVTNVPLTAVAVSTNGNLLTLRGTAPIQVDHILINGRIYPIRWGPVSGVSVAPTNWTANVVLLPGSNSVSIVGTGPGGQQITPVVTVNVEYTGPVIDPRDHVMISEIMYRPPQPRSEYVEVYNKSGELSFDLFSWRLGGLEFDFPWGALLLPNQFMVLTKDKVSFSAAFLGGSADFTFPGELDPAGETLSLITSSSPDIAIDRVRYEARPPWPAAANGGGSALQVIDVDEDNSRVSNWTDGFGWRYVRVTGVIEGGPTVSSRGTNFFVVLNGPGSVYVDDIVLVRGTIAEAGENVLQNGNFEAALEGTWVPLGNHSGSLRTEEVSHSGAASLKVVSTGNGSFNNFVHQYIPGNSNDAVHTLSFWYVPSTDGLLLTVRTSPGASLQATAATAPVVATPGQTNAFPVDLPPYDPVWLNELSPSGIEIYNAGTNNLSLSNYYLADTYSLDPHTIGPDGFMVTCCPPVGGSSLLLLTRTVGSEQQIVDYFNYVGPVYGAVPDGQPFTRGPLRYPTPALSNLSPRIARIVRIESYMYLRFEVIPGHHYRLEYKNELRDAEWQVLEPDLLADELELTYADSPAGGQRFYRLMLIP